MPPKGVRHPYPARALTTDLDHMGGTRESSSSQIRSLALLPPVTLSRMDGTKDA